MNTHRRILRLQRRILATIKSDVRKILGTQSLEIKRYYASYKREFQSSFLVSDKAHLLKACSKADIILMGDYHTFAQSQKAAVRILRELNLKLTLALEMIPSTHQEALNSYLNGDLDEDSFKIAMSYEVNWGFPWEQFRILLDYAKENKLAVLGLNINHDRLQVRDEHASRVIADWTQTHPEEKLFVLYGDLHLARSRIPRFIRRELKTRGLHRKILTIFQNSESLYWKLAAQKKENSVEVISLGKGRFCIMNAAPWVKLQSYLQWAEMSELLESDGNVAEHLQDLAHDRLRDLASALNLQPPKTRDFLVQTIESLDFLDRLPRTNSLSRKELKVIKYHVLGNRTVFVPGPNLIYLSSASINAVAEGVALFLHSTCSRTRRLLLDPRDDFFAAILTSTAAYFGSKILNHKRKCDLEKDFKNLASRPARRDCHPFERLQKRAAKLVLNHCRAQREFLKNGTYRARFVDHQPDRLPLFFETTRSLGAILGEKLYASYVIGTYAAEKVERLYKTKLSDPAQTRKLYLNLVRDLANSPLEQTSKTERL